MRLKRRSTRTNGPVLPDRSVFLLEEIMPLPKPKKDEKQDDFIKRCMSNDTMKEEFPDNDQRLAVCFQKWKDKDKKDMEPEESRKEIPNEDPTEKDIITDMVRTGDNIERRFLTDVELRKDDNGDGKIITGYAALFNTWSADLGFFKEKIEKGAFKKTIQENDIRALINHDPNLIIGRRKNKTLELWEDDKGLGFNIKLPDTSYADDLKESIKRKDITQNSFGFQTIQDEWSKDGKKRTLKEVKLFDISPVTFAAYKQTSVKMRGLLDAGIDYEALNTTLIRAKKGIITDSDIDLFKSTREILKRFIPVEQEPLTVVVEDPEHSDPEPEPDYTTLIRARMASMASRKYINRSKL